MKILNKQPVNKIQKRGGDERFYCFAVVAVLSEYYTKLEIEETALSGKRGEWMDKAPVSHHHRAVRALQNTTVIRQGHREVSCRMTAELQRR
jgi:hypothetical protein